MISHPSEDALLRYCLELSESNETESCRIHLEECATCRERLKAVESDIESIRCLDLTWGQPDYRVPLRRKWIGTFRNAAVFAIAVLTLGYLTKEFRCPIDRWNIIPFQQSPSNQVDVVHFWDACPPSDLAVYR